MSVPCLCQLIFSSSLVWDLRDRAELFVHHPSPNDLYSTLSLHHQPPHRERGREEDQGSDGERGWETRGLFVEEGGWKGKGIERERDAVGGELERWRGKFVKGRRG